MRYLMGIAFALVFGIGNVVKWIWDKHLWKKFADAETINKQLDII